MADLRELSDMDLLADLAVDAESDGHRFVTRLIEEWEDGTNRFSAPGERLYVAVVSGRPVGVGGLNIDPYAGDAAVGRVRHLYVATSERRLGVASELLDRIVSDARSRFRLVRLRTRNPQAAAFYRSRGFAEVDDDEFCTHQLAMGA